MENKEQKLKDRELLELAAKAYWAGEINDVVSIEWSDADNGILYTHADNQDHDGADQTYVWNPLEDDGEALRLSVRLGLHFATMDHSAIASNYGDGVFEQVPFGEVGPHAATRRAIVRAAAEIGKAA